MRNKALISFIIMLLLLCNIKVYATDTAYLPSKYDLRNEINIKVESQGNKSWCANYAEVKMIETYLQKTKSINYDLSEAFAKYYEEFGGTYGKQVLESDFPTKEYAINEANQKKFDNATSKAVVEKFEYLMNISKDTEAIKKYIMTYGGVFTTTLSDNEFDYCKGTLYRDKNNTTNRRMHGVVIIGWDDNYSRNNFNSSNRPNNNGAWLILNSWGTNWGNKGTAWVSYEDYYNLANGCYGIKSLTLSTGETIETELVKEEQKVDTNNTQQIEEQPKKQNNEMESMQNIFIILFAVAFILLIAGIILKSSQRKKNK